MAQASGVDALVRLVGVTKHFGGVTALDGVDFDLRAGEVHALLGENGAGKSTLIRILAGVHVPDAGQVHIGGARVQVRSVAAASALGIRVIHQELSLAPNLTVAENIHLGREPARCGFIDRRRMAEDARTLVHDLGLDEIADVRRPVHRLSISHRQLVEIARALSREARVLILDEPTSALSGPETDALFATLSRLHERAVGIIYISHRLEEIQRIADRVTVLRDGRVIGTQAGGHLDERELVRWMIGRDANLADASSPAEGVASAGTPVLDVMGLSNVRLRDVSFSVSAGEVLGVAGLVGAGRSELARAVFGIDPVDAGEVRVCGHRIPARNPVASIRAGLVLVPEDRQRDGLVPRNSVGFNLALPWTREWNPDFRPNGRRRGEIIRRAVERLSIRVASPHASVLSLSGGNQQKVLVGRWLEHPPKALILDEPTRGVDVGAREDMLALIRSLTTEGMAVVLISSDLSEVLRLSHRVLLLREGRAIGIMPAEGASLEHVMAELTGVTSP